MIIALLNQKGGVGKTTLTLHIAGEMTGRGNRLTPIKADPQRSSLDRSQQRAQEITVLTAEIEGLSIGRVGP